MPNRSGIGWERTRSAHRRCSGAPGISGSRRGPIEPTGRGLPARPCPPSRALRDGGFLLVAKAGEDKVLVQSPLAPRPALMTRDEFVAVWDGRLILMTRRAGLSDITRRFDITWFLGAIHKYRIS